MINCEKPMYFVVDKLNRKQNQQVEREPNMHVEIFYEYEQIEKAEIIRKEGKNLRIQADSWDNLLHPNYHHNYRARYTGTLSRHSSYSGIEIVHDRILVSKKYRNSIRPTHPYNRYRYHNAMQMEYIYRCQHMRIG